MLARKNMDHTTVLTYKHHKRSMDDHLAIKVRERILQNNYMEGSGSVTIN